MQKGADAAATAQMERLQNQNSMLQKVSRKLQEEVKLLREGGSVLSHGAGEGNGIGGLQLLDMERCQT